MTTRAADARVTGARAADARPAGSTRRSDPGGPTPDRQASDLLLTMARLARAMKREQGERSELHRLLMSGRLSARHLVALWVVALEGPLTVSELAASEGIALSTASLLVTQLADAGFVERREDEADRRRTVVSVAPAYRRESEELLEARLVPLRRALERLGPRKATMLIQSLQVVADEIAAAPTGPCMRTSR